MLKKELEALFLITHLILITVSASGKNIHFEFTQILKTQAKSDAILKDGQDPYS
jgi:hypothetical protein